jgi:hypothetical protein
MMFLELFAKIYDIARKDKTRDANRVLILFLVGYVAWSSWKADKYHSEFRSRLVVIEAKLGIPHNNPFYGSASTNWIYHP